MRNFLVTRIIVLLGRLLKILKIFFRILTQDLLRLFRRLLKIVKMYLVPKLSSFFSTLKKESYLILYDFCEKEKRFRESKIGKAIYEIGQPILLLLIMIQIHNLIWFDIVTPNSKHLCVWAEKLANFFVGPEAPQALRVTGRIIYFLFLAAFGEFIRSTLGLTLPEEPPRDSQDKNESPFFSYPIYDYSYRLYTQYGPNRSIFKYWKYRKVFEKDLEEYMEITDQILLDEQMGLDKYLSLIDNFIRELGGKTGRNEPARNTGKSEENNNAFYSYVYKLSTKYGENHCRYVYEKFCVENLLPMEELDLVDRRALEDSVSLETYLNLLHAYRKEVSEGTEREYEDPFFVKFLKEQQA
uniref:Uncharacterized protein n=1 Tax=Lobelia heterophylla subsp. heterophylla TaxID=2041129 RepID=A0A291EY98_9ASTR|nr:hypothetical protein Lo_he_he1Pt0290 [Lobelia heterophylla subsp. heterophylla]